jgi:hypothetical protein
MKQTMEPSIDSARANELAGELTSALAGQVSVLTGDQAAQFAADGLWSAEYHNRPLALAQCSHAADVQAAVRAAAEHDIPLSVLAGGHDWAGRAICEAGLVLDIRALSQVSVHTANSTVTVGGATLTGDLLQGLPADRITPTGTISSVGVAGLTLGGGYGRLISKFGLAADALKSAEVVVADGSLVTASESENRDLLWALCGGGGNYGVVTSLTLETYSVPSVTSAMIVFPLSSARNALLHLQEALDQAPDELSLFSGFMTLPTGDPGLFLQPLLIGESRFGAKLFDDLCSLDNATVLLKQESTFRDTFDLDSEKMWGKGQSYYIKPRNIARLDEPSIDALVTIARSFPTPGCALILHDFHGYASRVPSGATAFPLRQKHYDVQIIGLWDPNSPSTGREVLAWNSETTRTLAAVEMPGGYVNLLGPEDLPRVRDFYGPALDRLERIKAKVDPRNLFRSNVGRFA